MPSKPSPAAPLTLDTPAHGARPRRRMWLVGAALATGIPLAGHATLGLYLDRLERGLSRRAALPCEVASVEAGLTGTLRLRGVKLGQLFAAEVVEVSTSWRSVLSGRMQIDEVRVEAPRLAISVSPDGSSDLARLLTQLASGRALGRGAPAARARRPMTPRRILVSEGDLTVTVAGVGSLRAQDVELLPSPAGVRAIVGRVRLSAALRGACQAPPCGSELARLELELGRAAADLALPSMTASRIVAVGGRGTLTVGQAVLALSAVSVARMDPLAPLSARLTIDDRGAPRALELSARAHPVPAVALAGQRIPLWPLAALAPTWLSTDDGHFTGELALARGRALGIAAAGHLEGARLDHPVLAATPVIVAADLDLAATVQPAKDATLGAAPGAARGFDLSLAGSLTMGAAQVAGTVEAHRGASLAAALDLSLAPAPCQSLLASVPRALVQPLEGLELSGETGGRLRVEIDTAAPLGEGSEIVADLLGSGCRARSEPVAADVASLLGSREHTFADGSRAAVGPGVGAWVELRSLPAHVDGAFVAAEDARFFSHRGFDLTQIARSLEIDLRESRLARGGSTISQQLIKNEFLDGRRSAARKLTEAILTWRLEARLDKRQILERYLNIIELGPSIWGLPAAAQHWFGVAPRQLSVRQAAFLAALTPEPTTMTRRIRAAGELDRASATRLDTVLRAMKRHGLIDKEEYEAARHDDLDFRSAALRGDAAGAARRAEPPRR
ncbi:MAG: transglycosylase domain-containing protein [Myxococcales bacterium]|nr:transglycosylase domain-containing protein [Myxococcales bacterium]